MAAKIGDGDVQVERLTGGQQARLTRGGRHRLDRVEQQPGETRAAERRLEPARADEMGEFGAHLLARGGLDQLVDVAAIALGRHPRDRRRPGLGEARGGGGFGIDQRLDIGRGQPQIGQRLERLAGGNRLRQEHAVDSAGAGARDDIDQQAKADAGDRLDLLQHRAVDRLAVAAGRRLPGVKGTAGLGETPDFLGDAVHVDGEADPAIADQRQPDFLLAHRPPRFVCHQSRHAGPTMAQIGRWSDAVRAVALSCTPHVMMRHSGETMILSSRATGRRAWKLGPVSATR